MKIRNLIISLFVSLFFVGMWGVNAYAETITGTAKAVPASQSLSFEFSFSLKQQYKLTVTDPTGNIYDVTEDARNVSVNITDAPAGDYIYKIVAGDDDYTYSVNVKDAGNTIASVGESKPTITQTVSDFSMWFEDGDVCATWNYDGNVNITITDPARFNNIESNVVVDSNFYRRKIDGNVDYIQFHIVPSIDSRIDGAGLTYTKPVVSQIAAKANFPSSSILNVESIDLPIQVNTSGIRLKVYCGNYIPGSSNHNDSSLESLIDEMVDIGEYEIKIPLVSTYNQIVCCFIDEDDNAVTQSYTYVRDMLAPTINPKKVSLDNKAIYTDYTTTSSEVLISGMVFDEIASDVIGSVSDFYINDFPVAIDAEGKFSYSQPLTLGQNQIELKAVDASGNVSTLTIAVAMVEQKNNYAAKIVISAIFIALAMCLSLLIVKYVKQSKKDSANNLLDKKEMKNAPKAEKKPVERKTEEKRTLQSLSVEEKRRAEIERLTSWSKDKENK